MRRLVYVIFLATVAVLCSSCLATTEGSPDASPPAGENRPSEEPSGEPEPTEEPSDQTLKFGAAYTWEDGVSLKVSKPANYKPTESAAAAKAKAYLKFTVTVVNKSSKPLDLALTYITVQSSNKEAEQVFDSEGGIEGTPSTKLLKGRESEWEIAFGVADPKDVVMEVALQDDFERPSLIYST